MAIAAVALALFGADMAHAQDDAERDFSAERVQMASDGNGVLVTEDATVIGHKNWEVGLWMGLVDDPLTVWRDDENGEPMRDESFLARRIGGELFGVIGFQNRFQLALQIPLIANQAYEFSDPMFAPDSSFGIGDIRVMPKMQLLFAKDALVDVAFLPTFTIPSGTSGSYAGEINFSFTPELVVARRFGPLKIATNIGYRVRQNANTRNLGVNDELFVRAGAGYSLFAGSERPLELGVAVALATAAADFLSVYNRNYSELLIGAKYQVGPTWQAFAGGGTGLSAGFGSPDWRALAGLRYVRRNQDYDRDGVANALDMCPKEAEDVDGFADEDGCPDRDNDGDGIADTDDKAPDEAEDVDNFDDTDGAPDPDNDKDGILDVADACPNDPETKNGYQDSDGCPDAIPDTDRDGLNDLNDKCPADPEDKDGFEDGDGCPDPDNDKDGILDTDDECDGESGPLENRGCPDTDRDNDTVVDRLDNCPDEPGLKENQGCKAKQLVVLTGVKLKMLEKVHFATNKAIIRRRSYPVLQNVARVLNLHKEIKLVQIEGHTDSRGKDDFNMDLSQRRAESVVKFLIEAGVDAARLKPVGFGESRPIEDNGTRSGRAANRRVEFNILGKHDSVVGTAGEE